MTRRQFLLVCMAMVAAWIARTPLKQFARWIDRVRTVSYDEMPLGFIEWEGGQTAHAMVKWEGDVVQRQPTEIIFSQGVLDDMRAMGMA